MKLTQAISASLIILTSSVTADTIVTEDGSTINGDITGIDDGKLTIVTEFAGKLTIDTAIITSLTTDDPIYLKLEDGTTYLGEVSGERSSLSIDSESGDLNAQLANVTESWEPGTKSPSEMRALEQMKKLQRKWAYEAAFDLTGKSGNSESTGMGTSFRATLKGPEDTLVFFARANFEDTDGVKSADDARGGVRYSNNFADRYNWYVRSEFGYDAIKDIEQFFTVAAGFGYNFWETEQRELNARAGVGYLYEAYDDISVNGMFVPREATSAASLDFGLDHIETLKWGTWINRATYTPTIEEFGNFRFVYDSSIDIPLKAEQWSVRAGVNFNYDSEADISNKEELDTTYYVRMVLKWL